MVATRRVKSGNAELSQQIAKLMATLIQTRKDSGPPVPQAVPGNVATVVGVPPATQTPTMAEMALVRQPQPAAYLWNVGVEDTGSWASDQNNCRLYAKGRV